MANDQVSGPTYIVTLRLIIVTAVRHLYVTHNASENVYYIVSEKTSNL